MIIMCNSMFQQQMLWHRDVSYSLLSMKIDTCTNIKTIQKNRFEKKNCDNGIVPIQKLKHKLTKTIGKLIYFSILKLCCAFFI